MKTKKRVKAGTSKASAAERRALFIEAYIQNGGNATQAAITAGYSESHARAQGSRMATDRNIATEIEARRAKVIEAAQEKTQLTADEVLRSLARDLRFDPARLFNENGLMKKITELDEDTRLALRAIDYDEIKVDGDVIGQTAKIKFPEKTSAREQGMKHFGLYREDNEQKPPTVVVVAGLDASI